MRKLVMGVATLVVGIAFTGNIALALDGAAIYKAKCGICHGEKGEGKKMLGPAHKGNEFVKKSTPEELKAYIPVGRQGDVRKYPKEFPGGMPKGLLTNPEEIAAVVTYLQGDLQK